jgi:hypothetical protein
VRTADKVRVYPSPERAVMLSAAFARARALALEPALAPRHARSAPDNPSTSFGSKDARLRPAKTSTAPRVVRSRRGLDPAALDPPTLDGRDGWQAQAVGNIRTTGGVAIDARAHDVSRGGFAPALLAVRQEPVGASLVRIPVQQVRE